MPTNAHGHYPISDLLGWHGGMHLLAPTGANSTRLPVRAIADGTVAYVRPPTAAQANPESHPLGYNGWTDDGCVIIRHDTSIGANGDTETTTRFYSLYMHLNVILTGVRQGQAIHRKSELGRAGMFEGEAGCIHFEIICDDENLQRLIGRTSGRKQLRRHILAVVAGPVRPVPALTAPTHVSQGATEQYPQAPWPQSPTHEYR